MTGLPALPLMEEGLGLPFGWLGAVRCSEAFVEASISSRSSSSAMQAQMQLCHHGHSLPLIALASTAIHIEARLEVL